MFYGAELVAEDQCGPDPFDLDAEAIPMFGADPLTFTAPDGWSFSIDAVQGAIAPPPMNAWEVTIAPVMNLVDLPVHRHEAIYLSGLGESLGSGTEPASTVNVIAPVLAGEYLLELRGYVSRDGWTWAGVLYHWRVTIT